MNRSFIVHDVDQRSEEWHALRAGRLTASSAADVFAMIKNGEAAKRRDLRTRMVVEQLTGQSQDDAFVSKDMQRGIDGEADALTEYELQTEQIVQQVGFISHVDLPCGYSPDGVIGDFVGLLELKCPRPANHLKNIRANGVPSEYMPQVLHALWMTGAEWCDFASYCAAFPEPLRLFRTRVMRDAVDLNAYELVVRAFLREVEKELAEVRAMVGGTVAA